MPYFAVDDKLHSHPKAVKAGVPAMGLWAICGSWSSDHGTDGFVPEFIVSRFVAGGSRLASKLVSVGLWAVAERDGERGWQFHQWEGDERGRRNFTRSEVDQRRREGAERQAKSRQRRASQNWSVTAPSRVTDASHSSDVTRESHVSASDPSHTHPKPIVQNQEPLTAVGSLTNQDHGEAPEEQTSAKERAANRPIWCDEHRQPDDRSCPECREVHGDAAHNAKIRMGTKP